ncbi:MAG: cobalamin-independent methionine synthase II family protein [SAR202 cluster bacterium]|nr:cobalamin-independent methionine synthase II family protein [SAR202 cluster bacterium]
MTKSSRNQLFSTFVVGSLPRPQWVRDLIEDRKQGRLSWHHADSLLDAAVPSAISLQERAGLDYVSDGEWRRESYVKVFADAVEGFAYDTHIEPGTQAASSIPYPAVVSKMASRRPIAADEARFLKKHTTAKAIVAIPSPYTIGRRMWTAQHSTKAYPTREDFMEACIPIVRSEVQRLVRLGVEAIQLDDPWLALLVDPDYRKRENIADVDHEKEMSVKCVNGVTQGIEGVNFSVHLCHAHFNRKHGTKGSYDLIMDALAPMKVHRFAMEFATPDAGGIGVLTRFPKNKTLGLGVIDHTDKNVETPEKVVARVEAVLDMLPKTRITLNPDCGFSPSSINPMDLDEAYLKLKAMCQGAKLLREKYG